jgi:hypothetical protein
MQKFDLIISVAGWEERFSAGVCQDLNRVSATSILLYVFEDYMQLTQESRSKVGTVASSMNVEYREINVTRDAVELWKAIQTSLDNSLEDKSVLLNISTMPREVMWWICFRLEHLRCGISYVYYKPISYASDWLTRDTEQPRLLYQLSGVSSLGRPTCLLLLTGFDSDRAEQIIEYYEPELIILGSQIGTQFANDARNILQNSVLLKKARKVETFQLDAISEDRGFSAMERAILQARPEYNIIGASLGPKVSALALYQLQRKYPEIALTYAPSRQFNNNYSLGIGDLLEGTILSK